ncbi:cilia- and flagella-associated protein 251 isoform X2 [Microcaecilia unicolor]|nr:cilia- and flagella-associated protein 251-like isoform X2 [Microcaecilia unicolor]
MQIIGLKFIRLNWFYSCILTTRRYGVHWEVESLRHLYRRKRCENPAMIQHMRKCIQHQRHPPDRDQPAKEEETGEDELAEEEEEAAEDEPAKKEEKAAEDEPAKEKEEAAGD